MTLKMRTKAMKTIKKKITIWERLKKEKQL